MIILGGGGVSGGGGGGGGVSVSVTTTDIFATGSTATITTTTVTATASFGTGPYTYAWVMGGFDGITATAPTSATTAFRRTVCVSGESYNGYSTCTATDSLGATGESALVNITITRS